jgi:hypothetical protein
MKCHSAGCGHEPTTFQTYEGKFFAWCKFHTQHNTPSIEDSWMCDNHIWKTISRDEYIVAVITTS